MGRYTILMIIGIDEVGRGCWAGPLVAAAVLLNPDTPIVGLRDSKQLSARRRAELSEHIHQTAVAVGIGWVWPEAIDISGITMAVKTAMTAALGALEKDLSERKGYVTSAEIIIDGSFNFLPERADVTTLVKADATVPAVSAASIIAKVARDTYMQTTAHINYPEYGFDRHVGYGTAAHQAALANYGVTDLHRRSFKPVRRLVEQASPNT